VATINRFVHRNLLWLIVASYFMAAVVPSFGIQVRNAVIFDDGTGFVLRLPVALLAILLFIAGQNVNLADLIGILRWPATLVAGLVASITVPICVVAGLSLLLTGWHDVEESRCLVIGLGIVAAMPVAGSSAAWSQHVGGSSGLSIGLVIASTLLSPLTTPFILSAVCSVNDSSSQLGNSATIALLLVAVVLPSLAGMVLRSVVGDSLRHLEPARKLTGSAVLLLLCYSNATASLPEVVSEPDWDYLALVIAAAAGLCASGFLAGWFVARIVRATRDQERSLVFGLGMTNNGTGLVLAGAGLAGLPAAILPVIVYNLVQHVLAGTASRWLGDSST
jgi:BASS family bile acid:Na+ symporter